MSDTSTIPAWARWKAADFDGETFYYSHRPRLGERIWYRTAGTARLAGITSVHETDWRKTIVQLTTNESVTPILPPAIRTI